MPWVTFTADFDWRPPAFKRRVVLAYKSGTTELVKRDCATAAISAGKAIELSTETIDAELRRRVARARRI
jgi:flavoprotein